MVWVLIHRCGGGRSGMPRIPGLVVAHNVREEEGEGEREVPSM